MNPPIAKKIKKELVNLGDTRIDEYYWLNKREDSNVIDYLNAENAYTEAMLEDMKEVRENLFREIVGRIKQTDESVPYKIRGYNYYYRYEQGKEYPIYCRKKDDLGANEEVLIDVNELAKGHNYCHVAGLEISPNNNLLAFGIDTVSRRLYTIRIKDLTTGKIYEETIPNTNASIAWANDNQTLFYALKNEETLRDEKIMRHSLGTGANADTMVFHETNESFYTSVSKTKAEKYIMVASTSTVSDEYRFIDASEPMAEFKIIQPRERDLEYSVDHFGDYFYIRTNLEAKNFRLMKTLTDKAGKENWQEVIPHRADVLIDGFEIFKAHLVVSERKNASNQLRVIKWDDQAEHYIRFDEEVYQAGIDFNPDFNNDVLRFQYSSLTTPNSVYNYNMISQERKLMKRQEVIGDFDPARYESKRLFATATDGTRVPISMVYKKGIQPNGDNPVLLYGYGSYGISIDPHFNSIRLSLLDRGFIYVIAHIRGGQELGRQW